VPDSSVFRICTLPSASRAHTAGITWLGTENLNGGDGIGTGVSQFVSACANDSGEPVTLVAFQPHMHRYGIRVTSVVEHAGGGAETVFDEPFTFGQARAYALDPRSVMAPGDSIRSTCTYENTTGMHVTFGQSASTEMCNQFAYAYPATALENGVISLIGANNTCW
jgi:hypothetical protein